tara:strand:+ start:767 stop:988 length:222 start_codon:yes stop_codon:yes gene_type:complete
MFSKNGGLIWPAVKELVMLYGEEVGFNAVMEVRNILESRGIFSRDRMYTDQEVHDMAIEELRSILDNHQTEEC